MSMPTPRLMWTNALKGMADTPARPHTRRLGAQLRKPNAGKVCRDCERACYFRSPAGCSNTYPRGDTTRCNTTNASTHCDTTNTTIIKGYLVLNCRCYCCFCSELLLPTAAAAAAAAATAAPAAAAAWGRNGPSGLQGRNAMGERHCKPPGGMARCTIVVTNT